MWSAPYTGSSGPVRALVAVFVLCVWARHFSLSVLMPGKGWGGVVKLTSIPSRRVRRVTETDESSGIAPDLTDSIRK